MIKTKEDLAFYLREDAKRNGIPKSILKYYLHLFAGHENFHIYRFLKILRHYEYYLNTSGGLFHKMILRWYRFRWTRLKFRYSIKVNPNVCGYGLRIMHLSGGGGVRIGVAKAGNYCGFNAGVLIGTDSEGGRPVLGDHVAFGPGAKAFGKLTIGNDVFVAPNAVVTKDVPDNCIVGGVPAKILKYKDGRQPE